jgi:predicted lipoprotein with Yx(FWY)xxD motif
MTRSRLIAFLAGGAVVPLTALSVAACGGSGGGGASASTTPTAAPKTTSARAATVRVANRPLGKILVDSQGRTLYLFKKDSGKKSACFGQCASFWPPLRASGKPTAGSGARTSLVGTIKRSDGKPQVTYHGHPLYRFAKDTKSGQTNGEGLTAFGGRWFAVSAAGNQVTGKASKSAGGSGASSAAPKAPPAPAPPAAPKPAPKPAAPKASPPSSSNGIPQNGGGDGDSDNNGGPSDGDGAI